MRGSWLYQGLGFVVAAILVSGCAYKEPSPDAPAATLAMQFNLDDVIPGYNRFQDFGAFLDPGCEKGNGILGGTALGPHPLAATRRIEAGKRMYVRTAWINHFQSGSQIEVTRCVNVLSFVPEAGRRYELEQLITPTAASTAAFSAVSCAARLVDSETGKAPLTLQEHSSAGRCSYIYL